jgi:PHP family Zn ribbon phosphoesterase
MLIADFHNHSCLSPCGSLDLSPRSLAELAAARGVQALALTDHNTSLNCPAFARVCRARGIVPLFGMEATTQEEIHMLCLFTNLEASLAFSEEAYRLLLPFPNDPEKTGDQVYLDEDDNIEGEVEYYLVNPLSLGVDEIAARVTAAGGIVIPAHVDRSAFSMTSQLGVVVPGAWTAVECVRIPPEHSGAPLDTLDFPLITSSDAHYPEHVARRPFTLDITREELIPNGIEREADMAALKAALARRPRG